MKTPKWLSWLAQGARPMNPVRVEQSVTISKGQTITFEGTPGVFFVEQINFGKDSVYDVHFEVRCSKKED